MTDPHAVLEIYIAIDDYEDVDDNADDPDVPSAASTSMIADVVHASMMTDAPVDTLTAWAETVQEVKASSAADGANASTSDEDIDGSSESSLSEQQLARYTQTMTAAKTLSSKLVDLGVIEAGPESDAIKAAAVELLMEDSAAPEPASEANALPAAAVAADPALPAAELSISPEENAPGSSNADLAPPSELQQEAEADLADVQALRAQVRHNLTSSDCNSQPVDNDSVHDSIDGTTSAYMIVQIVGQAAYRGRLI